MLFDLLQERVLIFKVLVESLDLGLNMRQLARRLIEAAFLIITTCHKLSTGILQRLRHRGHTTVDFVEMVRRDFIIRIHLRSQGIRASAYGCSILVHGRGEMLHRLVLLRDTLAKAPQALA